MKKNVFLRMCSFGVILAIVYLLTSCGKTEASALVGKWLEEELPFTYEFFEDGSIGVSSEDSSMGIPSTEGLSWKVENGRFFLGGAVCDYKITGTTLTLLVDGNVVQKFKKQSDIKQSDKKPAYFQLKGSSSLAGKWEHESGVTRDKPENLELFRDGTGIVDNSSVTWKVVDKRFVLSSPLGALACDFRLLNEGKLILYYDDNTNATFVKKK